MLTGILSLLEAANKIYRVPYVDKILMGIQTTNFLINFENMRKHQEQMHLKYLQQQG